MWEVRIVLQCAAIQLSSALHSGTFLMNGPINFLHSNPLRSRGSQAPVAHGGGGEFTQPTLCLKISCLHSYKHCNPENRIVICSSGNFLGPQGPDSLSYVGIGSLGQPSKMMYRTGSNRISMQIGWGESFSAKGERELEGEKESWRGREDVIRMRSGDRRKASSDLWPLGMYNLGREGGWARAEGAFWGFPTPLAKGFRSEIFHEGK